MPPPEPQDSCMASASITLRLATFNEDSEMVSTKVNTRRQFLRAAFGGAGLAAAAFGLVACGGGGDAQDRESALGKSASSSSGPDKTPFEAPSLGCGIGNTQKSINITITAGLSGAPAGFSLQWMKHADFLATGWPAMEDQLCAAGFSGNANLSRYNLGPGESVTVNVGEFLFDNGASTTCVEALECGTDYVFRAFAHATSDHKKSAFSSNTVCSTLPCFVACNYTQGYWKTHGPVPTGNNSNEWPVASLWLGGVEYTDLQLLAIFNTPAKGNGLVAMAHQLIAAKLNVAKNGGVATADMVAADAMIGSLVVPPVGAGSLPSSQTGTLTGTLAVYNEGGSGPGHCS
jgi:hypothetical protein